jgi:tRNA nucleotidyltransferase (CCA-adding enzyme)
MEILKKVQNLLPKGVRAYLVGGCVRDSLMGIQPKDIDVEVFGIGSINVLEKILSHHGHVSTVGESFGVVKLTTHSDGEFDFSLPRKDSKCGVGHKDFRITIDPTLTIEEAASRRDYTINSMSIDIWTGELIDPFNGRKDLESKILRHTSDAFKEDPLRVFRGFQFTSRYDLTTADETLILCNELVNEFYTLPKERIWAEFEKWATKSLIPSKGLEFLVKSGWIEHFSEIQDLIGCPQDPEWHPEGDVFEHTCQVVDQTVGGGVIVTLAGLCHDLGKPETTELIDGRIRSIGHCQAGIEKTRSFLKTIGCPHWIITQVEKLVSEHLVHLQNINVKTVKRLIVRLGNASVEDLVSLIGADHAGRGSASSRLPDDAIKIKDTAEDIGEEIKPILMGRHLIELGMEPGPHFGPILKDAFEAQLDGLFENVEDGIEFLKTIIP